MLQSSKTHVVIYASYIWIAIMHAEQSLLSPRTLFGGEGYMRCRSERLSLYVRPSGYLTVYC